MTEFIGALLNGLSLGGTYTLIALGLVFGFRATGTFNFAHGNFIVVAAFLAATLQTDHHFAFFPSSVLSLAAMGVLGALTYRIILQRTVGMSHFVGLIATLGLAAILDAVVALKYGSKEYNISIPGMPSGVLDVSGARISWHRVVTTLFAFALAGAVAAALRFTHLGTELRAAGQDAVLASQGGIRVRRIYTVAWAGSAILAGIAGIMVGSTQVVNPTLSQLLFLALPAMVLGGMDSAAGAILGGIVIGLFQAVVATYVGGDYVNVLSYVLLLATLLVIPEGILGTKTVSRV